MQPYIEKMDDVLSHPVIIQCNNVDQKVFCLMFMIFPFTRPHFLLIFISLSFKSFD